MGKSTIHKRAKLHVRGTFTFTNASVKALIAIAIPSWAIEVRTLYDETTGAGFWLVGDQGVYLMHNGKPADAINGIKDRQPVVYALECNPDTTPDWWEVKRAVFGGDDGVDFIQRKTIQAIVEAGYDVEIAITLDDKMLIQPKGVVEQ